MSNYGLAAPREAMPKAGEAARKAIALGDELAELVSILHGWGAAIRAASGYPASGPHDLAAHAA